MWLPSTANNNKIIKLTFILLILITQSFSEMSAKKIFNVDFEVYGKVQGVFFRKYTQQQAQALGLRGWCMNTEKGTVQGVMQGEEDAVNSMKRWLKTTGSPQSRIDKAEFNNEKVVKDFSFSEFKIRR